MLVDDFWVDAIVVLIGSVDGSVFGVGFLETKFFGDLPNFVFGWRLDFDKSWQPRPGVDAELSVTECPNFAFGFLAGLSFEAAAAQKKNGVVVIVHFDIDFFGAENRMIVADIFICHDDFVAFVANASERMLASIEDSTSH